ncbi:MAG: NUDIX hydrolase [Candidatus Bathyarchaeota archaeon]|nr:NUDIX hydrolase [Candidatus Bathyarchaeota archaeon]
MVKKLYPEHPLVGVGIIILQDGKLLLAKRGNEPAKGKWSIPGGVVELGENLEGAVIREAKEETGLDVEMPRLIDVVDQVDLDESGRVKYHFVIVDYVLQIKSGVPKAASDVEELRWVPLSEVETYNLTDSFRRFFQKNKNKLQDIVCSNNM